MNVETAGLETQYPQIKCININSFDPTHTHTRTHTHYNICIQHIICKYTRQVLAASWGKPEVYCHVVVKSTVPVAN